MANYSLGDIIYVNFPFTDIDCTKPRPCLIIASDENFVWALMVTSSNNSVNHDQYIYELNESETNSPLPRKSSVRCNIIMTIKKTSIIKKFTSVKSETLERIKDIGQRFWHSNNQ